MIILPQGVLEIHLEIFEAAQRQFDLCTMQKLSHFHQKHKYVTQSCMCTYHNHNHIHKMCSGIGHLLFGLLAHCMKSDTTPLVYWIAQFDQGAHGISTSINKVMRRMYDHGRISIGTTIPLMLGQVQSTGCCGYSIGLTTGLLQSILILCEHMLSRFIQQ